MMNIEKIIIATSMLLILIGCIILLNYITKRKKDTGHTRGRGVTINNEEVARRCHDESRSIIERWNDA